MSRELQVRDNIKTEIAEAFGRSAAYYDRRADLQKETARRLLASLEPWKDIIPPGLIIELGCGTGFVTEGLAKMYPNREILVSDISKEMVETAKEKLQNYRHLDFQQLDAEEPPNEDNEIALCISGFAAQWFTDPSLTLGKWLECVKPGGLLLASFPGNKSFPEWKKCCQELGIPFTGNTLPDTEEIVVKLSAGPAMVDFYEDTVTRSFDSSLGFFKQLKKLGTGTRKEGRALTPRELSLLVNHWDSTAGGEITVSYHLVFLAVKRDL